MPGFLKILNDESSDTVSIETFDDRTFVDENIEQLGVGFSRCSFDCCFFIRCNMSGVVFDRCTFRKAKFIECVLIDTDMTNSMLDQAEFKVCAMRGADFTASHISRCTFNTCDITEIKGLIREHLTGCPITLNCIVHPIVIDEAAFAPSDIPRWMEAAMPASESPSPVDPGGISKPSGASRRHAVYPNTKTYVMGASSSRSSPTISFSKRAYLYCSDAKFFEFSMEE